MFFRENFKCALLLISLFCCSGVLCNNDCSIGDKCVHGTTNARGEAKLITECPSAIADLQKNIRPWGCGFQGLFQIICCPYPPGQAVDDKPMPVDDRFSSNRNERVALRKCREYAKYAYENVTLPITVPGEPNVIRKVDRCGFNVVPLIVGGTLAGSREFPHMTLVGYGNNPGVWKCGGTIISENHILTAGHCLVSQEFGSATWVRVGDLNYESDDDEARPENIRIKRHVPFPEYTRKTQYNDLALLELERRITLSPYARPANLLKVTLELFSYRECNKSFEYNINRKLSQGILDESQLCAGSHDEEKDTCEGDSGGPLQIFNNDVYCMYNVIGVTSFGKGCGTAGQPGVYTRISHYIDWLEKTLWPNQ
uniref:Putative trypsin-like serine protease n=1 Tax=Lutzomyia longipalpis TaxID=7200 RepID=A0A1B0GIB3_LUTLO